MIVVNDRSFMQSSCVPILYPLLHQCVSCIYKEDFTLAKVNSTADLEMTQFVSYTSTQSAAAPGCAALQFTKLLPAEER